MDYWIAGHITGGLANRLFQHAAAMGLAEKYNRKIVFYLPQAAPTNHGPFENIFKLFPSIPVLTQDEPFVMIPEAPGHVFTFTPFSDNPPSSNLIVDGWRQTELYFPKQGVHVTWDGLVSKERQTALLQKYDLIAQSQSTCFLHIRLGDYKILPHHQIDIGGYIQKASSHFQPNSRFLVFSDEAQTYKTTFEVLVRSLGHQVMVVEESDEIENLFLMSHCLGGAIVGNSTFSWWGAYFARQRAKNSASFKACFPTVWGKGLPPARDVVPSWGIPIANE